MIVQKRVHKGTLRSQPVLRVKGQTVLKEVTEIVQSFGFFLEPAVPFEHSQQLSFWGYADLHLGDRHGLGVFVVVMVEEVEF